MLRPARRLQLLRPELYVLTDLSSCFLREIELVGTALQALWPGGV